MRPATQGCYNCGRGAVYSGEPDDLGEIEGHARLLYAAFGSASRLATEQRFEAAKKLREDRRRRLVG